jgi:hypothetical protein
MDAALQERGALTPSPLQAACRDVTHGVDGGVSADESREASREPPQRQRRRRWGGESALGRHAAALAAATTVEGQDTMSNQSESEWLRERVGGPGRRMHEWPGQGAGGSGAGADSICLRQAGAGAGAVKDGSRGAPVHYEQAVRGSQGGDRGGMQGAPVHYERSVWDVAERYRGAALGGSPATSVDCRYTMGNHSEESAEAERHAMGKEPEPSAGRYTGYTMDKQSGQSAGAGSVQGFRGGSCGGGSRYTIGQQSEESTRAGKGDTEGSSEFSFAVTPRPTATGEEEEVPVYYGQTVSRPDAAGEEEEAPVHYGQTVTVEAWAERAAQGEGVSWGGPVHYEQTVRGPCSPMDRLLVLARTTTPTPRSAGPGRSAPTPRSIS